MLETIQHFPRRAFPLVFLTILADIALSIYLSHVSRNAGSLLPFAQVLMLVALMRGAARSARSFARSVALLVTSLAPFAAIGSTTLLGQVALGVVGGLSYWCFLPIDGRVAQAK